MRRVLTTIACAGALFALAMAPTSAKNTDSDKTTKSTTIQSTGSAKPNQNTGSGGQISRVREFCTNLPKRLCSFAVGSVVGVPIAIGRKMYGDTKDAVVGGVDHPMVLLPAVLIGAPLSLVGGLLDGCAQGPVDAWVYSGEKPFSKQSFSLGEMYDF